MQILDPQDPRRPYVQIAASLRAEILTGNLKPGEKLPSGTELAEYFGVTRATVANAIHALVSEGFVRSRTGSGAWVRDQASLPGPDDGPHPLAGAATFIHEMGQLKNLPRSGWLLLGIPSPESVAEHSFRVSMVGMILAAIEGADVGRTMALCALHDAHETRIGDTPSVGRAYVKTATPETVTEHQVAGMPDHLAKVVRDLTAEYEATETMESRLAHDADKLETLATAAEYQAQGYDAGPWRETSLSALRTDAGKQLAQAIGAGDPRWWAPFAASYHELRASTRGSDPHARNGNPDGGGEE